MLILGASGKTGRRVAALLRLRGVPVRAASRSSSTRFDWGDPSGWDAALKGVAAVYVVAPTTPGPVSEFVARAKAAGVSRLVLLSGRGADKWGDSRFGRDMLDAEAAVRGSTLEWTVLRPTNFFQNFTDPQAHCDTIAAGELALPVGPLTEAMIDVDNVADVIATVLTEPGRHAGQVYELSGPRALTYREAVELISLATDRPISYSEIDVDDYAATLIRQGLDEHYAYCVSDMYVIIARGTLATPTDGVRTLLGREPRAFEDFVVRAAAGGSWLAEQRGPQ
ncbi:uncharacterized protein YbjT (DUF2867 family) [Saccharopolyspora spinosa]|uniref:Uncharacterized protein YbjT (DUF2867 family) n=1 Tax=Saccharopolyspora spinosa TaxID=60894 RepID=A0A2N3Y489_SACSN|nr:uncharacterized protein YbjT (DUF2867 family) [Saccharopolyspora spinosa]